ncbi:heterokaryon incompatibility protein-domain-containing protein, partial [Cercophora newfieldiana]
MTETWRYATLSHCWGLLQISRLLTTNQAEFKQGIRVSTLQPTFQHAIRVVAMLGLRYLWIDSFCILQDSATDWETESALMGKVYRHASVNIAATSSSDARGGLFFDRDPDLVQPFVAYSAPANNANQIKMLEDGWYVWKNDMRWSRVGREPLNLRGWVLQERLLSTRTVHFAKSEMVWHCLEDLASESVPYQFQSDLLAVPMNQIRDYTDIRIAIAAARTEGHRISSQTRARLYRDWRKVLAHYSKCGLTKETDKLVAIFGVADELEQLTGDWCLAGMWRSQMPSCLLWLVSWDTDSMDGKTIAPDESRRELPAQWRAPSWSWASLELAINYP